MTGGIATADETPHCCRCHEEFRPAKEPTGWRMGELRRLARAPAAVRRACREVHDPKRAWLCGNCYFDLTDQE